MRNQVYLASFAVCLVAAPAQGQFSSDFPGVPRAAISNSGGTQGRTVYTITGFKVPNAGGTGDTIAGGLRIGWGQSYRIQSEFEVGFDITLFDAHALQPPAASGSTTKSFSNELYLRGATLYDVRIGAKYRPISALDLDGNGYELALGVGYQPALKPAWGIEKQGDSTRMGGQFGSKSATTLVTGTSAFKQNPFAKVNSNIMIAAMGSYRAKRFMADAALMNETIDERTGTEEPSPNTSFKGLSPRVGASFRLTPGFAVGGSYWGDGSPPWYDQIKFAQPGKLKTENYGLLLQFGSDPESGIDMMITSPTGKFTESLRLYFRSRSTH